MKGLRTGLNPGLLSVRIKKARLRNAAEKMAGKRGLFRVRPEGILLGGKKIVLDPQLSVALIERNFRNLLLTKELSKTALLKIFSAIISRPQEAEKNLSNIGAIFNIPEKMIDRVRDFSVIKPQEGALFLAEEGEIYTRQQIENGEVPGLGEQVIEFMETHGLDRLVFAKGTIKAPYLEIGLGGQIQNTREGMSGQKTINWATALPVLDQEKCSSCIQCVLLCPEESIRAVEKPTKEDPKKKKTRIEIDLTNCKGCGICANICPDKISAITMIGKDTPQGSDLLQAILRSK
jgi:pyruvate ferredoxin oxidoreductase delta subunit